MKRRDFIRTAAIAVPAIATANVAIAAPKRKVTTPQKPEEPELPSLQFKNGKFKILQLTDTHFIGGDARSQRALDNVAEMLDTEKPDLVIHTGDIIFAKPARENFTQILSPITERHIPFAVALGNHDEEFGLSRTEVLEYIRQMSGCLNTPAKNIHGASNDVITINSTDGKKHWALYLFDTGNKAKEFPELKSYDYIHDDQLQWYRQISRQLKEQNQGTPLPSIAFMHIPITEYLDGLSDSHRQIRGNLSENPCSPIINSGAFVAMREQGDIKAVTCGHDHDDDYVMKWRGLYMMYGRYSGGDTVYNNLKPNGARIFELTEGSSSFKTWIRIKGGRIEQTLTLPDEF